MDLEKKTTKKGCIEYVDPDMRTMPVPIRVPAGFSVYRVCANGGCMNPQHMYYVDADTAHQIECGLRDVTLRWLRKYFKVNPDTLESLVPDKPPLAGPVEPNGEPKLWLPRQ